MPEVHLKTWRKNILLIILCKIKDKKKTIYIYKHFEIIKEKNKINIKKMKLPKRTIVLLNGLKKKDNKNEI